MNEMWMDIIDMNSPITPEFLASHTDPQLINFIRYWYRYVIHFLYRGEIDQAHNIMVGYIIPTLEVLGQHCTGRIGPLVRNMPHFVGQLDTVVMVINNDPNLVNAEAIRALDQLISDIYFGMANIQVHIGFNVGEYRLCGPQVWHMYPGSWNALSYYIGSAMQVAFALLAAYIRSNNGGGKKG